MSAFIVDAACMTRCVSGIRKLQKEGSLRYVAPGIHRMIDDPDAIGAALFALNESAVWQRYPQDAGKSEAPAFRYQLGQDAACSPVAAFKALRCLRYQCSEGEAEKAPLYLELTAIIAELAETIVCALPEYNKAEW